LDAFLGQQPQVSILSHFLKKTMDHAPLALDDAVIVGLDVEWYERGTDDITELGICILDTKNISEEFDILEVIQCMQVFHARIKENAHMLNTELCPGRPDIFHFGTTKFVTTEEARQLLFESFTWREEDGSLRPVIFIGHGVDNDLEQLKQHFGIDVAAMGCVKSTIDTQVMAIEAGIRSAGPLISLESLLSGFGIREEYLHTAGNDVGYAIIAGLLTANLHTTHCILDTHTLQTCIDLLKAQAYHKPKFAWGTEVFCTRCDAEDHFHLKCRASVHCDICTRDPLLSQHAATHKTEKCL
ncbi:hypothetical protein BDV96DRAFT_469504, partial [Lophiotrema nucula]